MTQEGSPSIDMTGERFGRLVVRSYAGRTTNRNALWLCECDCGEEKIVRRDHLVSGGTRSCGCLHAEVTGERRRGQRGWLKERVGYAGAHARVRLRHGRAAERQCRCGAQAEQWAYTHLDPNELTEVVDGWGRGPKTVRYSLDPAFYIALCRRCHVVYDQNFYRLPLEEDAA